MTNWQQKAKVNWLELIFFEKIVFLIKEVRDNNLKIQVIGDNQVRKRMNEYVNYENLLMDFKLSAY